MLTLSDHILAHAEKAMFNSKSHQVSEDYQFQVLKSKGFRLIVWISMNAFSPRLVRLVFSVRILQGHTFVRTPTNVRFIPINVANMVLARTQSAVTSWG